MKIQHISLFTVNHSVELLSKLGAEGSASELDSTFGTASIHIHALK